MNQIQSPFYGRTVELARLERLRNKKSASLVVIKGRRRIGKSRLIAEFGAQQNTLIFTGLPPEPKTTAQMQRDDFARQMAFLLNAPPLKADDWGPLLWHLAQQTRDVGPCLIVLDEVNWMGSLDETFLGQLKSAWDLYFKNNPQLIMILSGSMSRWIETNIMSSTGFMGRVSLDLTVDELPLSVCNLFWRSRTTQISAWEKFKVLSVTGGVPRYLEEIDPSVTAEENIYHLAFQKGGVLVEEFERIFNDLFSKRSESYAKIVKCLAGGDAVLNEICERTGLQKGGSVSEYLEDLIETGYVSRAHTWNIRSAKPSTLSRYRLKDNYLRFYLKYIEPNLLKIEKGTIKKVPGWSSIMGLQFENLVVNNAVSLYRALGIDLAEIVMDNPYFQRPTKTHQGCQIDYLIQTKFNCLYVCEIKFYKHCVPESVIDEVEEKIRRLNAGRNFSFRPVLIHVNGVDDTIIERDYFADIIDFSELLESDF